MFASLRELVAHRDLLRNFLARDLRVRYKGSALGVLWSLLNPVLMLLVYTVAFSTIMRVPRPSGGPYAVFFMAAFLPWTFFASSAQMGATALLSHAGLIQKVWFPRAVLPLSITGANLVNMFLALAIFVPFAIATNGFSLGAYLALVPVTIGLFLFAAGVAVLLSALTVHFRDVDFLIGFLFTAWFFVTPIVYGADRFAHVSPDVRRLFALNPARPFTDAFRDAFFGLHAPPASTVLACVLIGAVSFVVGYAAFVRLERNLAEAL